MKITARELKKIRKALPTGSYNKIVEKTGLGLATVKASLFYTDRVKSAVLETALVLIEEEKTRVESLKISIKQLA